MTEEISEENSEKIEELKNILTQKFIKRFWNKVERRSTGCWEWQGALLKHHPYGQVRTVNPSDKGYGKVRRAHQVAYMIHNATTLPEGLVIGHECNNSRCCNPLHLVAKTHEENMKDMFDGFRHNSQIELRKEQLEKLIQDLTESEKKFAFEILKRQFQVKK